MDNLITDSGLLELYDIPGSGKFNGPDIFAIDDRSGILVSWRLANTLGLDVGDNISLLINTSDEQPDEDIFEIRGLYDSGIPGFDNVTAFLPLSKAQAFTRAGDRASAIVILLDDQEDVDPVADALSVPGLEILTWRDLNAMMLTVRESAMGILYIFYGIKHLIHPRR